MPCSYLQRSSFLSCLVNQVEAHPIPEHMRPRRVVDRAALVGDAAGYVTKCSGEGIYFAAKSGRMAGQAVSKVVSGNHNNNNNNNTKRPSIFYQPLPINPPSLSALTLT